MTRFSDKRRMWCIGDRTWLLDPLQVCLENIAEMLEDGVESVHIFEYRAADGLDVDLDFLTDQMWDILSDLLMEDEELSHDDGWPCLTPSHFKAGERERNVPWFAMRHALRQITRYHVDYSEAAWQPTGKDVVVTKENIDKLFWSVDDE